MSQGWFPELVLHKLCTPESSWTTQKISRIFDHWVHRRETVASDHKALYDSYRKNRAWKFLLAIFLLWWTAIQNRILYRFHVSVSRQESSLHHLAQISSRSDAKTLIVSYNL